jgi:hypothetical protein
MHDLFISYARADIDRVRQLAARLTNEGWSVWWDQDIPIGHEGDVEIQEALAHTRAVLVVWTEASVGSRWVKTEAAEGLERGILFPVRLDEAVLPLEFRRIQTANLRGWPDGPGSDEQLEDILARLRQRLGGPAPSTVGARIANAPDAGYSISGIVANALTPTNSSTDTLPGVVLDLQELSSGDLVATSSTDPSGAFRFTGLAPGAYRIRAVSSVGAIVFRHWDADKRINNVAHVIVGETDAHVGRIDPSPRPSWDYERVKALNLGPADFVFLQTDCQIRGAVAVQGEPWAGAVVDLTRIGDQPQGRTSVVTDAAGRFVFTNLPEGIYKVALRAEGADRWPVVRIGYVRRDRSVADVAFEFTADR